MKSLLDDRLSTSGRPIDEILDRGAQSLTAGGSMRRVQSAKATFGWFCMLALAVLMFSSTAFATVTYDLKNDWGTTNPNGPWSFLEGSTLLPYHSSCDSYTFNCPPTDPYLPIWARLPASTPSNEPYYEPGDIYTHSWDQYNGPNPSLGESTLKWTAPAAGTIDISGDLWYLQAGTTRSNDFFLYLNGTLLTSGTIAYNGPYFRPTPFTFSFTGDHVNAGDMLSLVVRQSPNQNPAYGSEDGVNLTVVESPSASTVPEPGSLLLFGTGLMGVLGGLRRKLLA